LKREAPLSSEDLSLCERVGGALRKDSRECLCSIAAHDGSEQCITFKPLFELLTVLSKEGVLCTQVSAMGVLVRSDLTSGATSHNITKPRVANEAVMLHSIAILRRILVDKAFPLSYFA